MKQWAYFVFISVLTVICVCFIVLNMRSVSKVASATIELEQNKKAITDLEGRIKKASSEIDLANRKVSRLQAEITSLLEQRKADLQEIENLRKSMQQKTISEATQDAGEQELAKQVQQQQVKDAEDTGTVREQPVKYDAETVMKMISSGGSLQDAIRRIITSEGIDSTLQQHGEDATHLVAAASLTPDPDAAQDYLEQAAVMYPDSAMAISSLINAQIAQDRIDESTLTYIDQLRKIDPTNALADCYAAYYQFNNGDIEAALHSLSQASVKDRFADGSIDLLMARYDYFLNEGCTDSVSLGLSAFDLPFSYMSMLREIGNLAMQQAEDLYAAGQYENALQIVTNTSKLGGTLSSSGRFIVSDRVGMALQISALEKQKKIYEALGDVTKVAEVDSQLQAVQQRSEAIDIMVKAFGSVLQNMTDQDIADYVNGTILNGEFSTLQNIPEITAALELARNQQQKELSEPNIP
jgi:tetratricopeptide (TPR) repeat protein